MKPKHYPNTNKYKIFKEFEAGKRPSELVEKYSITYKSMMTYFEEWKHKSPKYVDPVAQLAHFIHDEKKSSPTNNKTQTKQIKPTSNPTKPVKKIKSTEGVGIIPQQENNRIPIEDLQPLNRKVRFDPFDELDKKEKE